jgi:hypothetical protein
MAKKSRRGKRRGQPVRLSQAQMVQPGTGEVAQAASAASTKPGPQMTDLRDEYRYVIADLKRIAIIALAMLVVLIVLAFLLT